MNHMITYPLRKNTKMSSDSEDESPQAPNSD